MPKESVFRLEHGSVYKTEERDLLMESAGFLMSVKIADLRHGLQPPFFSQQTCADSKATAHTSRGARSSHRMEAAGRHGIPQVVCPGAIDMVNVGPLATVPQQFLKRNLYVHNPTVTLMRTTPDECARIGRVTAEKLHAARGPVTILIPLQGVSAIDKAGAPFYSPEALAAYCVELKATLRPEIPILELNAHINDDVFARLAVQSLIDAMHSVGQAV